MTKSDPFRLTPLKIPAAVKAHRESLYRLSYFRRPELQYLFWESTLRCNLRCVHCGSACEEHAPRGELGTSQVLAVLDTILEDFNSQKMTLAITGGEPLLRPDLEEVCEKAVSGGMRVGMVTNATLAKASRVRDLVASGMSVASVSVDGVGALHDAMRGEGTYVRTMQGIRELQAGGMPVIEIVTCVRPANLPYLPDLHRVVTGLGIRNWRLITIDRMGRAALSDPDETWLAPPQVRQLLEYTASLRKQYPGPKPAFNVSFSCGGYLGTDYEFKVRGANRQCYAGLCVASLLYDGQVSACPSLPREWAQGSVKEMRFSEIWKSRFQKFRDLSWRREGPCKSCAWFGACLGGGLHERLAQPDDFCWLQRQKGT